jgi:hypothetical protein
MLPKSTCCVAMDCSGLPVRRRSLPQRMVLGQKLFDLGFINTSGDLLSFVLIAYRL